MTDTNGATAGATEDKVERRAKHGLVTVNGGETKKFEEAQGITYALVGNPDDVFTYNVPQDVPAAVRMLALFGARTLATNTASQIRQKDGGEDEQMEAVKDRFAMLDEGTWIERAERTGTGKIDVEALTRAAIAQFEAQGETRDYATVLAKLTENRGLRAKVMNAEGVRERYNALKGIDKTPKKLTDVI